MDYTIQHGTVIDGTGTQRCAADVLGSHGSRDGGIRLDPVSPSGLSRSCRQVLRLGEQLPTGELPTDNLLVVIECQIDGHALETAHTNDVFV